VVPIAGAACGTGQSVGKLVKFGSDCVLVDSVMEEVGGHIVVRDGAQVKFQATGASSPRYQMGISGDGGVQIQLIESGTTRYFYLVPPTGSAILRVNLLTGDTNVFAKLAVAGANLLNSLDVNGGTAIGTYGGNNPAPSNGLIVSGNVGIGTTSPDSKLDVRGSINRIVFLRPLGAPNDDGLSINNAIAALPDIGGIIYLLPANTQGVLTAYNIKTPITNYQPGVYAKKAVKLRGFGGLAIDYFRPGQPPPLTSLKWDASVSGVGKRVLSFESPDPTLFSQDFEVSDLTIDGSAVADVGLFLNRISSSKFVNVQVQNLRRTSASDSPSVGIYLIAFGGTDGVNWNAFINCSVEGAARGLYLAAGGGAIGNPSHNRFLGLSLAYYSELDQNAGIWLDDCDNNLFQQVFILPRQGGQPITGYGVVINHNGNGTGGARANYFYNLEATGDPGLARALKVIKADTPFANDTKNLIFGYDMENAQKQPQAFTTGGAAADPAQFLHWVDSKGVVHLGRNANFSSPVLSGTLENVGSALYITLAGTGRVQVLTT
jgi:hypothetical protein